MTLTAESVLDADEALSHSTGRHSGHNHVLDGLIDLTAGTAGAIFRDLFSPFLNSGSLSVLRASSIQNQNYAQKVYGGIANVYTGQPLDTVKVKMQTFPHLYRSSMKCFADTFRNDGIRGLYAGTLPALVANVAENAILFAAYGYCQKGVVWGLGREKVSDLSPVENATAGGMAAFFAALALCPTELVKCRLQAVREMRQISGEPVTEANRVTPASLCRQIFREEGIRGFCRGMMPTMAREIPGYFCFFGGYETCRHLLTPPGKTKDEIGLLRTAMSGSVGGMALWTAIFPADVVKSRMQIQGKGSLVTTFLQILREEGFRALYKGLAPTLVRTCLSSGCLFISYEYTKKFLNAF